MIHRSAAAAYENQEGEGEGDGDAEDQTGLIEVDAGQTGELSCHLFQTDADSHANSGSFSPSHTQLQTVDNLLASLESDAARDDSSSSSSLSSPPPTSRYFRKKSSKSPDEGRLDQLDDWLVSLVLWYKDDNPSPIYTLDARHQVPANPINSGPTTGKARAPTAMSPLDEELARLLARARHYSADESRYKLDTSRGSELKLSIARTNANDSGQYKCRVDFRNWPTQSHVMKLSVKGELRIEFVVGGGGGGCKYWPLRIAEQNQLTPSSI